MNAFVIQQAVIWWTRRNKWSKKYFDLTTVVIAWSFVCYFCRQIMKDFLWWNALFKESFIWCNAEFGNAYEILDEGWNICKLFIYSFSNMVVLNSFDGKVLLKLYLKNYGTFQLCTIRQLKYVFIKFLLNIYAE